MTPEELIAARDAAKAAHDAAAADLDSARQTHTTARAAFDAVAREPVPARQHPKNPSGGPRMLRVQQGGTSRAVLPKDFSAEQRRLFDEFRAAKAALESAQIVESDAARVLREAESELASAQSLPNS